MPQDRPNILFLMTDQHRGDTLGIEGHPVIQTPNMDNIARRGFRFTRAYSECPTCIAARRCLLSGQEPATAGLVGYQEGVTWDAPITLPQALADAGYQTHLVGRSMHQHPPGKGYGYETLEDSDGGHYEAWMARNGADPAVTGGWFGGGVMHNDYTAHTWPLPEHLHFTNWTVTRALEYLRQRDTSRPFFLTVSFIAPHPPLQPPAFYMDRYLRLGVPDPVIGDWCTPYADEWCDRTVSPFRVNLTGEQLLCARAAYYGLINHVDDQIRRLLNEIGNDWIKNTIVAYTSDHGEMLGDHHYWRKQMPFEGSARIPLLISAPRHFDMHHGGDTDAVCGLHDIMPTLLDMVGVDIPDSVEGRSLLPLMRGESPAWRECLHIEHAAWHQSLTDGREKYVWMAGDGRELLFDLTEDPDELHDLSGEPARADRLTLWRKRLIDKLRDRPEGFTDGKKLIPGRPYKATLDAR